MRLLHVLMAFSETERVEYTWFFFGSRVYECSYFLHFASLGGEYKRLSL